MDDASETAAPRRKVLVASRTSADRVIVLERLLAEAAARAGWGERLELRRGGLGEGAGRVSDAGMAALRGYGIDAAGLAVADLARRPALLDGVEVVVCDRGDIADTLVDWDEAGAAVFVCVDEIDGGAERRRAAAAALDEPPIGEDATEFEAKIDEILRRLVAASR